MTRARRRWILLALVVAIAAAVASWSMFGNKNESRAIEQMAPSERAALYEQTFALTRTLCEQARRADALRGRCASTAELLLELPECDDGCREFAAQYVPRAPSR